MAFSEIAEVRKKAVEELSLQESLSAGRLMDKLLSERPLERTDLPLPRPITVVYSPPPGSGKRVAVHPPLANAESRSARASTRPAATCW